MVFCDRAWSRRKYDNKIQDDSTGSIIISSSDDIQLLGVVTRRLFKTTSVDFDVPLAASISIQDDQGTTLGRIEIDETPEPSRQLYEALRKAARRYFGLGVVPVPDRWSSKLFRYWLPKVTSGECTETDSELIRRAFEGSSSLTDPPPSARCDRLLTVPMARGHLSNYEFSPPVLIERERSYLMTMKIHRRGWYKFLHEDEEIIRKDGVDVKLEPKERSHVINAVLKGIKFSKVE